MAATVARRPLVWGETFQAGRSGKAQLPDVSGASEGETFHGGKPLETGAGGETFHPGASDRAALVASIRARLQRNAARLQSIADHKTARIAKKRAISATAAFERSPEWVALSAEARRLQPWCSKCKATEQLQGDHIKPKSRFPALALDPKNIQVLCWPCNRAKGTRL